MKHEQLEKRYKVLRKANRELRAENTKLRNEIAIAVKKRLDLEIKIAYLKKLQEK